LSFDGISFDRDHNDTGVRSAHHQPANRTDERKAAGNRRDPALPLVFMHIPKSAGTALVHRMRDALRPSVVIGGFDRSLFGDFSDFQDVAALFRDQIYDQPASVPTGGDLIAGHMSLSSLRLRYPSAEFMTLLREPIVRLLSLWLFWRQQTDQELALWGKWGERVRQARLPLAAFLALPNVACQTDNVVLRMLLWPHALIPNDGFIDPRHDEQLIEEATQALGKFGFVGLIEDPAIEDALAGWVGPLAPILTLNETLAPPPAFRTSLHRELNSDACMRADQRSRLDLLLWQHVGRMRLAADQLSQVRHHALLSGTARFAMISIGVEGRREKVNIFRRAVNKAIRDAVRLSEVMRGGIAARSVAIDNRLDKDFSSIEG